jgi:asparagine synthase (glutamine-hydrolysing)
VCEGLVQHAIKEGDRAAFGQMILVGQFVILGQKFGVKKAEAGSAGAG